MSLRDSSQGDIALPHQIPPFRLCHGPDAELRRLVVGWATQEELRNMAVKQGMRTLRQEAINLVNQDITSISEVIRSVYTL